MKCRPRIYMADCARWEDGNEADVLRILGDDVAADSDHDSEHNIPPSGRLVPGMIVITADGSDELHPGQWVVRFESQIVEVKDGDEVYEQDAAEYLNVYDDDEFHREFEVIEP